MTKFASRAALAVLVLGVVAHPHAATAQTTEPSPERREGATERNRELGRRDADIRRARGVTRRILHDRRATPDVQRQATELNGLLDRREQILTQLEARHKDFVDRHKADIDELEQLRDRAREIDARLRAAREDVLKASQSDIAALKETSTHAADVADALRATYFQQRRDRVRRGQ